MRQLLEATVQAGTGRAARLPIRAYGKTGTSQNYRDAWFIGFAGNLVVGVWVGNDDNSPMNRVTGGSLPALIWKDFMSKARRTDRKFQSNLPKIAAFRAEPSYRASSKIQTAALQSILVNTAQRYALRSYSSNTFGNVAILTNLRGQIQRYGCHLPQYASSVEGCRKLHARMRALSGNAMLLGRVPTARYAPTSVNQTYPAVPNYQTVQRRYRVRKAWNPFAGN